MQMCCKMDTNAKACFATKNITDRQQTRLFECISSIFLCLKGFPTVQKKIDYLNRTIFTLYPSLTFTL